MAKIEYQNGIVTTDEEDEKVRKLQYTPISKLIDVAFDIARTTIVDGCVHAYIINDDMDITVSKDRHYMSIHDSHGVRIMGITIGIPYVEGTMYHIAVPSFNSEITGNTSDGETFYDLWKQMNELFPVKQYNWLDILTAIAEFTIEY